MHYEEHKFKAKKRIEQSYLIKPANIGAFFMLQLYGGGGRGGI